MAAEGWQRLLVQEDEDLRGLLEAVRTVAVVGISQRPDRAGHYVPAYLQSKGYRILGVNPSYLEVLGLPCRPTLADLEEPVDMVLLFRKKRDVETHLPEILALHPRPRAVWMQTGIRHAGVAEVLAREGIAVVQDRCVMVEHNTLFR